MTGAPEGGLGWGGGTEGVRPEKARLFPYGWSRDAEPRLQVGTGQVELDSRKRNTPESSPERLPPQLCAQALLMFPQEVSAERNLKMEVGRANAKTSGFAPLERKR